MVRRVLGLGHPPTRAKTLQWDCDIFAPKVPLPWPEDYGGDEDEDRDSDEGTESNFHFLSL